MKKILALVFALAMTLSLAACGSSPAAAGSAAASSAAASSAAAGSSAASGSAASSGQSVPTGVEDGVLTIAMECAYAPYNWSQPDDSNGAVPIKDSNEYANGYDIMMAKKLCEANGWKLEVVRLDWDSLVPAVQTGTVDAVIAGQSMTADRMEKVDFAGPYLYATIVCLTKSDSSYASAKGISDLSGGTCTSQLGTIWYDSCLPQIPNAKIQTAAESAPAMLMALETGTVDFVCTDMPTAQGALIAYPDMKLLDFANSGDDFKVSDEDVDIGISVMKGNTYLKDALNSVLSTMTADNFNDIMAQAIAVQPIGG
jgi:putative lysine transport system substrate-binding protein